MKGLMIKDIKILMGQQKFLLIIIMIAIMAMMTNMDASFFLGYITFMFAMFSLTTLSYDEYEHGMTFLMTLPVTRKDYVTEKYAFAIISSGAAAFIGVILYSIIYGVKGNLQMETFMTLLSISFVEWLVSLLMVSLTVPFVIQFGAEKGRLVMISVIVGFVLIGLGISKLVSAKVDQQQAIQFIDNNVLLLVITGVVLCLAMLGISYISSIKILKKKEY